MIALGSVTEVRVPTRDQEDLRDLSRLRSTAATDLAHARQHVNAILLRHGIRYPEKTKWTKEHGAWLHRQRFDSPVLQFTYDADVEQVELLAAHLKRIDQRVAAVASQWQPIPAPGTDHESGQQIRPQTPRRGCMATSAPLLPARGAAAAPA